MNAPVPPPKVWCQTATGRAFDLLDPSPDAVDFWGDVALGLARSGRYAGQVLPAYGPYSIAQHSVVGADWLRRQMGEAEAMAFLLHDAHEAYINDWPTPAVAGAAAAAAREFVRPTGYPADHIVQSAVKTLKHNLDRAIYGAAGLGFPLPSAIRATVARVDIAMLNAERRILLAPPPLGWGAAVESIPPLPVARRDLVPWPWERALDEYRTRLRRWLPAVCPR